AMPHAVKLCVHHLAALFEQIDEIDALTIELDLVLTDAAHIEQIVYHPNDVTDLSLHPLDGLGDDTRRTCHLDNLEIGNQRCERIAQLMRQHRDKLIFAVVCLSESNGLRFQHRSHSTHSAAKSNEYRARNHVGNKSEIIAQTADENACARLQEKEIRYNVT